MRLWTVHEPRDPANAEERADRTIFVKDGFSWPGLLFPLPWLLIQRLWVGTLVYLVIAGAAGAAGTLLPLSGGAGAVLALIGNLYVALEGNDMRRRKLARRGYVQTGSALGRSRAEAELAYFSARDAAEPVTPVASRPSPAQTPLRPGAGDEVLGLFPQPGGMR